MLAPRTLRTIHTPSLPLSARLLSSSARKKAAGDTGSVRPGGERTHDSWNRREKAAEDMYIREREKQIMQLLRDKIKGQEAKLAKDLAILSAMEDQYGHAVDVGEGEVGRSAG